MTIAEPRVQPATEEMLLAVGAGCAEIVSKAGLQRDVADRERQLAIASERERIARDLHDSVGQVLTGMGMILTEYVEDAPDDEWRWRFEHLIDLAARGAKEVRDSIYSLMFLEARRLGLAPSLRALTRKFEDMTGLSVRLEVIGDARETSPQKDDTLFRVAHETLMNVERHARASRVSIELQYRGDEVALRVSDDGVGIDTAPSDRDTPRHFGLAVIERRLDEVGGQLRVDLARPTGTVIEACIPTKPSLGRT